MSQVCDKHCLFSVYLFPVATLTLSFLFVCFSILSTFIHFPVFVFDFGIRVERQKQSLGWTGTPQEIRVLPKVHSSCVVGTVGCVRMTACAAICRVVFSTRVSFWKCVSTLNFLKVRVWLPRMA